MKKNFSIAVLIAMISFAANAESPCRVALVLNGIVQNWFTTNFTVAINQGDTLLCSVATGSPCGNCTIDSAATYWIFRGIIMNLVTIAATDTGVYTLYAQSNISSTCSNDFNTFLLTVNYATTSLGELASADGIKVSPTLSGGIFKINGADKNFEQLLVSDCMGRIVFITQNNLSEINLSRFSSGIYYYAITDEKKKVWRGRVVKE
ncbi:MAG: T9SS type A sorting domain-containing protein [Bacteroidota bacterium]